MNRPFHTFRRQKIFPLIRNGAESRQNTAMVVEIDVERLKELERENLDLKIANRGKDYLIDQLKDERKGFYDQLLTSNRKVGELESKFMQLEGLN